MTAAVWGRSLLMSRVRIASLVHCCRPDLPHGHFSLVTPFQIVLLGKSPGETLAQEWQMTLWESVGKVRVASGGTGGTS